MWYVFGGATPRENSGSRKLTSEAIGDIATLDGVLLGAGVLDMMVIRMLYPVGHLFLYRASYSYYSLLLLMNARLSRYASPVANKSEEAGRRRTGA